MAEGQQPGGQTQKLSDIVTSFRPTKVATEILQFSNLASLIVVL